MKPPAVIALGDDGLIVLVESVDLDPSLQSKGARNVKARTIAEINSRIAVEAHSPPGLPRCKGRIGVHPAYSRSDVVEVVLARQPTE